MADVTLHFNGRGFRLACAPGEEARLEALAAAVSARLESLVEQHGQVGDERLLLMAALQYADEADDLRRAVEAAAQRPAPRGEMRLSAKPTMSLSAKPESRARRSVVPAEPAPETPSGEER